MIALVLASLAFTAAPSGVSVKLGGFSHNDPQGLTELSGLWLFYKGDSLTFARPTIDEGKWEQRRVPMLDASSAYRWAGKGWYRLHLHLGDDVAGVDQMLALGMVREAVEIYVNGALVAERGRLGSRPRGGVRLLPLTAIIPGKLLVSGTNVIAVRVYDPTFNGGLVSGPLLFGSPPLVRAKIDQRAATSVAAGVGLALVSLCIALGQMLARGRSYTNESTWLIISAFGLTTYHLSGTGLFEATLPNLELATRLPLIGGVISAIALAQYFSARYDAGLRSDWPIMRMTLIASVLLLLFLPAPWYFDLARPFVLVVAIVGSLYAAHVSGQSLRRGEAGGLALFFVAVGLVVVAVLDSLTASRGDLLPPFSSVGGVGALVALSFVNVRQASAEFSSVVARMQKVEKRFEERAQIGLLDAAALSIKNSSAFLDVAIREAAIVLSVRRCSLALEGPERELRIVASVGLPRHATQNAIPREGSIAGYVFSQGVSVSNTNLPEQLQQARRTGKYVTDAFLSFPIRAGARTVGVLNVSDKNDGLSFTADDERMMSEVCAKLALVIARTG